MVQANESFDKQSPPIQQNKRQPLTPCVRVDRLRPVAGYLCVLPVLAITVLLTFILRSIIPHFIISNTFLVLATSLIALFWGTGPTLLMLILGIIFLDFFVIPSSGSVSLISWPDIIQVFPFLLGGLLTVVLTAQRQRALSILRQHAQELEALNLSLYIANQTKDQQVAMTAHELKTPLTTLRLYTQRLQRMDKPPPAKAGGPERSTIAYQRIEEQLQRLTMLIEDLHGGPLTSSQDTPPLQYCNLTDICRRIVEHQRLITERMITLSIPSTVLAVSGHSHRLEQVLNNLITNAVKYSPEGSCVEVNLSQRDCMARISVHNAGPGIAPDRLPLLFTPYYRTPETWSSSIPGQGLGLAIVQAFVEQHHGRVWCESSSGKGATFIVELPLLQEH